MTAGAAEHKFSSSRLPPLRLDPPYVFLWLFYPSCYSYPRCIPLEPRVTAINCRAGDPMLEKKMKINVSYDEETELGTLNLAKSKKKINREKARDTRERKRERDIKS